MQIKIVLLVVLMGCAGISRAQSNNDKPVKKSCSCAFSGIYQIGDLEGSHGSYFQFQAIYGMRYKTWFAGIGTGADFYRYMGYPVFLDVRKYLLNKPSAPFLYADGGIHFAHVSNDRSPWVESNFKNGLYYDVGAGYKWGVSKRGGLLLSGGYSFKHVVKRQSNSILCIAWPCHGMEDTYTYQFSRLSLKVGWQF